MLTPLIRLFACFFFLSYCCSPLASPRLLTPFLFFQLEATNALRDQAVDVLKSELREAERRVALAELAQSPTDLLHLRNVVLAYMLRTGGGREEPTVASAIGALLRFTAEEQARVRAAHEAARLSHLALPFELPNLAHAFTSR